MTRVWKRGGACKRVERRRVELGEGRLGPTLGRDGVSNVGS